MSKSPRPRAYCTGCRWSRLTTMVGADGESRVSRYACAHRLALDGQPLQTQLELRERYVGSTDAAPGWCPENR